MFKFYRVTTASTPPPAYQGFKNVPAQGHMGGPAVNAGYSPDKAGVSEAQGVELQTVVCLFEGIDMLHLNYKLTSVVSVSGIFAK